MLRRPSVVRFLILFLGLAPLVASQTAPPSPQRERFQNAEVIYGWVQDNRDQRLRTFITRPKNAAGKVPGYATVRMDKPGVGESQGDCSNTDFTTELSGYQAACDAMLKYDFIDPERIFVVGLSNGRRLEDELL